MRNVMAAVASDGFRAGLVATAFGFGLRHGIDWDHIAAITDITGTQVTGTRNAPRRALSLATCYALGHAATVLVLGTLAVLAGDLLPAGVDAVMERVVGVTLVVLGLYVFGSLARHGRRFRMRSRWMLLFSGAARGVRWARARAAHTTEVIEHEHEHGPWHGHVEPSSDPGSPPPPAPAAGRAGLATERRVHRHRHSHRGTLPDDPFASYGPLSSFVVGVLHGVGAETPTQVLIFLAAARAGGTAAGLLLLVVFVTGLLVANSVVALVSAFGFLNAGRSFVAYATVAVVTGAASIVVGSLFVLGEGGVLPAFFGGA